MKGIENQWGERLTALGVGPSGSVIDAAEMAPRAQV